MARLELESAREFASLRVQIDHKAQDRVERYRELCAAIDLADLVERALVYVMGRAGTSISI